MDVLGSADEANRGHAKSMGVESRLRFFHQQGMIGQAQIIIGAKVEDCLSAVDHDGGLLGGGDHPLILK